MVFINEICNFIIVVYIDDRELNLEDMENFQKSPLRESMRVL